MCAFVYLKYNFASIYLFLFVSITTCNTIAERVSGQFVETSYTSVENVGGGGLEYYKLMWGTTRREKPNFELSMGKAKRGTHDF